MPHDTTRARHVNAPVGETASTAEVLIRYGILQSSVYQYRYLAFRTNAYDMRCPQELPQILYTNGVKIPTSSDELEVICYENFPSLEAVSRMDYSDIPDHEQLAFPEALFAQKISFVFQVCPCPSV